MFWNCLCFLLESTCGCIFTFRARDKGQNYKIFLYIPIYWEYSNTSLLALYYNSKIDIYFSYKFTKRLLEYPIKILFYPYHLFHKHSLFPCLCSLHCNVPGLPGLPQSRTGNYLNNITLWWQYWRKQTQHPIFYWN